MKINIREHSKSTKMSDLFLTLFTVAYFLLGFCFAEDFFACFIFLLCVLCIVIIKYFKLTENES